MTEERERPGREPGTPPEPGEAAPPPAPPPVPEPARERPPRRRLTRSRRDSMIGGVAGGLAEYTGIDPALVRILIVIFTLLTGGVVILLYIAAWIVMPEAPEDEEQEAAPAREDGHVAALVVGLVLILIGVWALLRALDIPAPPWDLILSVLLILTGLAIVVWSRGGLHGGLFVVALVLTGVLALSTAVDVTLDWESGFGERSVQPATFGAVESSYSHAFGSMTVDLTGVDWPAGTHALDLSIAFGEMQVLIPSDVEFRVAASTAFGETQADGRSSAGIFSDLDYETPGYDGAERRLDLDISTAFGSTEVRHR